MFHFNISTALLTESQRLCITLFTLCVPKVSRVYKVWMRVSVGVGLSLLEQRLGEAGGTCVVKL